MNAVSRGSQLRRQRDDTPQSGTGLFTPRNNEQVAEDQTRTVASSPRVCEHCFSEASFTASSMKNVGFFI